MSEWIFDPEGHRLRSGEVVAQLTPKAAAVLDCLVSRTGDIVTREDLLAKVWPGLHVTPDLAREYIHDLRVALGDDAQHPKYIETVRGTGFRLIGGVRKDTGQSSGTLPIREVRATVAILKPDIREGGAACEHLAEDIATDVINQLGRYRDIAVVARLSSFSVDKNTDARTIAEALDADYLVESSVAISDDTVRAQFLLADGATGQAVWSDILEQDARDLHAARDTIVGSVVTTLVGWHGALHVAQFKVATARDPGELNAFEHFIRGCDIDLVLDEPGLKRSIDHFRRSLDLEPRFARCWAMKSVMLRWAYDVYPDPTPDILAEAAEAIEKAYLYEPGDPSTLALVAIKWAGDGDLERAAEATRRAERTARSDADACIAVTSPLVFVLGDFEAAARMLCRAYELNPALPGYHRIVETRIAFFIDDYEGSVLASRRGFEHVSTIAFRALSYAMLNDADAARAALEELATRFPRFDYDGYARRFPIAHPDARVKFDYALDHLRGMVGGAGRFAALDPGTTAAGH